MNGDVEAEAPRPRPLSGGLWTLFSWLRRDDRASSSDSLSSAGSDRTAASFAFLTPAHYPVGSPPLVLPPSGPPTDSYKKRVLDRNQRRQHDRDITLHRKYGLYRSEGSNGYDNFSLPQARKPACESIRQWDRGRRAASEIIQSRLVHVPGKRRAPLPPVRVSSAGPATTLPRRPTKRRAPQPPVKSPQETKENTSLNYRDIRVQMNSHSVRDEPPLQNNDVSMGCKSEKYSKKDSNSKTVKTRSEKSFLKQIFDNRKRNSAIETTSLRLLPSISELDKQAAELIENNKLKKAGEQNCNIKVTDNKDKQSELRQSIEPSKGESWICTTCLRKYDGSVADCLYCVHEHKRTSAVLHEPCGKNITSVSENYTQTANCSTQSSSNRNHVAEEKQKLKDMLKEMKDSLPKKPKHGHNELLNTKNNVLLSEKKEKNTTSETPTLRIGSTVLNENEIMKPTCSSTNTNQLLEMNKCVLVTQQVVLEHAAKENLKLEESYVHNPVESITVKNNLPNKSNNENAYKENLKSGGPKISNTYEMTSTQKRNLNTPLKISSLLNPVYISKCKVISEKVLDDPSRNEAGINTTGKPTILTRSSGNSPSTSYQSVTNVGDGDSKALKENKLKDQIAKETKTKNEKPALVIKSKDSSPMGDVKLNEKISQVTQEDNPLLRKKKDFSDIKDDKIQGNTKQLKSTENVSSPNIKKDVSGVPKVKPQINGNTTKGEKLITRNTNINIAVNKPLDCLSKDMKENEMVLPTSSIEFNSTSNVEKVNQHTRRRELINQLEQSIAKGDENAAAEAAVKLAQLRLSCSVLSFSSQIVSEPSTSSSNWQKISTKPQENNNMLNKSANQIKCKKFQPVQTPGESKANGNPNLVLSTEKSTKIGLANNVKSISTVKEITPTSLDLKPEAVNNNKCGGDKQVTSQSTAEASTSKQKDNDKIS